MQKHGEQILEFLQNQQPDIVAFLKRMTLAESPSSVAESQDRVHDILAEYLKKLDFKTRPVSGKTTGRHLYASPMNRKRYSKNQLLLGHYDTVWPLGTLDEMPFVVKENIIKGPGVFDMKGGLAQIVFALQAIQALELPLHLTPVIFVNGDEEIGSRDSRRYIQMLAKRVQRSFVLEPSMGSAGVLKTARKGVARYTINIQGKAAHAGLDPESGASAIHELSFIIQQLFSLNDQEKGISVNVGTIDGGLRPNVIAPTSQAVVDVRVQTQVDAENIEKVIFALKPQVPGVTLSIEGGIGRPALEPTQENHALWMLAQDLGKEIGLELEEGMAGGGSDGNITSQYTATLDGLGPVGDGAHAHHEFLYIDKTIERAALLTLLLISPPVL